MLQKIRKLEAPSIRAASSNSRGMVIKNWRSRKMLKALDPSQEGTMSGKKVSSQPRVLKIRKVGIRVTALGSISVERTRMKRKSRPLYRSRAKEKAASEALKTVPAVEPRVMISVFSTY